ncbi:aspartate--tRNA ligase 2, cytoplasmic-like protein [Tanacetum coccineum]
MIATSENTSKETRLNNTVLSEVQTLSAAADQAIIRLESHVANFLLNQGFCEMFPPMLTRTSQGGAASIAQSPLFYNQMAICGDLERVFVAAHVFTSQDSSYKFTCLEVEMEIKDSYYKVYI